MAFEEKYLDVLQNIEFPIQVVYKEYPDLLDSEALSAIESLIEFYTAEERKRLPRQFPLSVRAKEVYEGVKEMCDFRLGKELPKDFSLDFKPNPISFSEMIHCLKTIKNSIIKWNKWYGIQGYLNFVKSQMPYV